MDRCCAIQSNQKQIEYLKKIWLLPEWPGPILREKLINYARRRPVDLSAFTGPSNSSDDTR